MRTVTSPGGDDIQVLPDSAFTERAAISMMWASRLPVLAALWTHGEFTDEISGRATRKVQEVATEFGYRGQPSALNAMVTHPSLARCITRRMNGKRCYSVKLVALPQTWLDRLVDQFPVPPQADLPTEHDRIERSQATTDVTSALLNGSAVNDDFMVGYEEPWEPAPMELNIAGVVAMQMLTRVVEIISTGTAPSHGEAQELARLQTDLREVEHRLHLRLEENSSLRRKLSLAGDELSAVKLERDGLRQRLRIAEHNLQVAGSADVQRQVTEQVRQELAKIMTAKPGPVRELASDRDS